MSNATSSPEIPAKKRHDDSTRPTYVREKPDRTNLTIVDDSNNQSVNVKHDLLLSSTTEKPSFHFITKASKSTPVIQTTQAPQSSDSRTLRHRNRSNRVNSVIMPTTYAPPKYYLKHVLPKSTTLSTTSPQIDLNVNFTPSNDTIEHTTIQQHRTIKTIRKFINPIAINNEFAGVGNYNEASEEIVGDYLENKQYDDNKRTIPTHSFTFSSPKVTTPALVIITTPTTSTTQKTTTTPTTASTQKTTTSTTTITTETTAKTTLKPTVTTSASSLDVDQIELTPSISKLNYNEPNLYVAPNKKRFRTTVEVPRPEDLLDREDSLPKQKPDQFPPYKPKPVVKVTQSDLLTNKAADVPKNTSIPARISRVNTAIKSLIALGSRRPNTKTDNQTPNVHYNDIKQRYLFLLKQFANKSNLHEFTEFFCFFAPIFNLTEFYCFFIMIKSG